METSSDLIQRWRADLGAIIEGLIHAFDLRYRREVEHLSSSVSRWLDFRLRYVEPRPRAVRLSDRALDDVKSGARPGFEQFLTRVVAGDDINPYQGRGLTMRHDTSHGERDQRTDLLFADWGILHFHLSPDPIPDDRYYSKSADWLLHALITPDELYVVAVVRHPGPEGFADPSILEAALRSFPAFANAYRVPGVTALRNGGARTQADIHALRAGGVMTFFAYDGAVYSPPGGGISTASTSGLVQARRDWVDAQLEELGRVAVDPDGPLLGHAAVAAEPTPSFMLRLCPDGVGLPEQASGKLFSMPAGLSHTTPSLFAALSHVIAPPWVIQRVEAMRPHFGDLFHCPSAG